MVDFDGFDKSIIPCFPASVPCNVCSKEIALDNVWRKHADTGSWGILERDIFAHKHRGEEKSKFLLLDEATGIVSNNPHLNQRFVKEEIFREDELNRLGIEFKGASIYTKHTQEEILLLLNDISSKVANKEITTRKNRGRIHDILDENSLEIIKKNKANKINPISINNPNNPTQDKPLVRQSKRTQGKIVTFFGRKLYLRSGDVNNLYRDIFDLYEFYLENKKRLSKKFPAIIRMALRLLCEAASKDKKTKMGNYINNYFKDAKDNLDQDNKTLISNQNVTETNLEKLLHTGAHNYTTSSNFEQTLAISIIVGAMLSLSHGGDASP